MRTTLLGSLLDAARAQPRPRRRRASRCSSPAASTCPADGETAGSAVALGRRLRRASRPAPIHEPHRLAALAVGAAGPGSWRGGGAPADFFALKGVLEALAGQLGAELAVEAAARAVPAPGPRRRGSLVGGADAGWIGELHPLVCREWDLDAAVAFEIDLAALLEASAAGEETYEDVTTFPAVDQDLAVVVPTRRSAAERPRRGPRRPAASCCARPTSSTSTEGEQVGEGRQEPRAAARVPGRRPHPHRRRGRRAARARSRPTLERDRRRAPWLSRLAQPLDGEPAARVLVAGASGFAGALAAQLVWRHPRLELAAATSRAEAGTRLDEPLPALPGPARADRARPRRARGRRRGDRRLPARRVGAGGRRAARPRPARRRPLRRLPAARPARPTSAGTAPHGAPELLDGAVYGLPELYRDADPRGRAGRQPRLLPDRLDPRAGAARRSRA